MNTSSSWFTVKKLRQHHDVQVFALAEFHHWEQVVSYLVIDQTQTLLIDTGMGYASIKNEVEKLTALPVKVLLTHAHWDHIGGASEFSDVEVFAHHWEQDMLTKGFKANEVPELIDVAMFSDGFAPKAYEAPGRRTTAVLHDGQGILLDSVSVQVTHTPGHTPGSVSFFIPEMNLLATGDTLYPGPLYGQMPESNMDDYVASIEKLAAYVNNETLILPGHNAVESTAELVKDAQEVFAKYASGARETEIVGKLCRLLTK